MSKHQTLTSVSTSGGITTVRVHAGDRVLASLVFLDSEVGAQAVRSIVAALSPKKPRSKAKPHPGEGAKLRVVRAAREA